MISMRYDSTKLPIQSLLRPVSEAGIVLARLDERIGRSPIGGGWIERSHFTDACASLWIDGELVHLEDLVLHDAGHDIRAPSHELTIARDVLRTRRRIASQSPAWALSPEGLRSLRGTDLRSGNAYSPDSKKTDNDLMSSLETKGNDRGTFSSAFDAELAEIDAVLARTEAVLADVTGPARSYPRERESLAYDLDWNEDERLDEWRGVLRQNHDLPPVLQALIAFDAWTELAVLQHAPWLGRLLAASILREEGVTTAAHLGAFNLGLKSVSVDRRRHRDRETRLLASAQGLIMAAEIGLKEHDRLALARQMMERKLVGRRSSSKLPALVDLVMEKPIVSSGMVSQILDVTPQAARRILAELGLREVTGRGRFQAWGII
ncbi:RHE_PE00001 family protein [Rhizobium sp. NPDC090275]|uniref:RHE_PE00001 family protein n=1 Tax=Rhizobium sp. NPDC090275 TaxID=3364498 RepID=UPI00383A9033